MENVVITEKMQKTKKKSKALVISLVIIAILLISTTIVVSVYFGRRKIKQIEQSRLNSSTKMTSSGLLVTSSATSLTSSSTSSQTSSIASSATSSVASTGGGGGGLGGGGLGGLTSSYILRSVYLVNRGAPAYVSVTNANIISSASPVVYDFPDSGIPGSAYIKRQSNALYMAQNVGSATPDAYWITESNTGFAGGQRRLNFGSSSINTSAGNYLAWNPASSAFEIAKNLGQADIIERMSFELITPP